MKKPIKIVVNVNVASPIIIGGSGFDLQKVGDLLNVTSAKTITEMSGAELDAVINSQIDAMCAGLGTTREKLGFVGRAESIPAGPKFPIRHGRFIDQFSEELFIWYDEAGLVGGHAYSLEGAEGDLKRYQDSLSAQSEREGFQRHEGPTIVHTPSAIGRFEVIRHGTQISQGGPSSYSWFKRDGQYGGHETTLEAAQNAVNAEAGFKVYNTALQQPSMPAPLPVNTVPLPVPMPAPTVPEITVTSGENGETPLLTKPDDEA